jgi:hypothetical protein
VLVDLVSQGYQTLLQPGQLLAKGAARNKQGIGNLLQPRMPANQISDPTLEATWRRGLDLQPKVAKDSTKAHLDVLTFDPKLFARAPAPRRWGKIAEGNALRLRW